MKKPEIRTVQVTRYITPLREGGSMPAIAEADDGFLYVLKFRGAGQGPKALIAELIGCEIARLLGFPVPELVFALVDESFGRTEGDEEIQDLLKASQGLNLGLHYLSGSVTFDALATPVAEPLATGIVWLDALLMNIDRTIRNPNMLWWDKKLWLIDFGASLYFHHSWNNPEQLALSAFPAVKDHVLIHKSGNPDTVSSAFRELLTTGQLSAIIETIPDSWLSVDTPFASAAESRAAYLQFFENRLAHHTLFENEIRHASKKTI